MRKQLKDKSEKRISSWKNARSADAVFTSVPSTYFYEIKSGVKLNENTIGQEVSQRHSGVKAAIY